MGNNGTGAPADVLVVGGGIAGITAAVEAAEAGLKVVLIEKEPSLGGRVAQLFEYFPKLCPPSCGIEINLRRIKNNPNVQVYTLSELESLDGKKGEYNAVVKVNPRYVTENCTVCGECEKVCEIEVDSEFDYNMGKRKAVYLPHEMSFPFRHVVDPAYAKDGKMQACVDACKYNAIDLNMEAETINLQVSTVVYATGWKPYDATKLENLNYGKYPNLITNMKMERLAAPNGPTQGKILRPSDNKEIESIVFVQCAGSRDENHLPYCSAVCCLASLKQSRYIREMYPDANISMFFIDVRSPGRLEDFYTKVQEDEKMTFYRGKVAAIAEDSGTKDLTVTAENTITGDKIEVTANMVVLATGLVPNTAGTEMPLNTKLDDFGFIAPGESDSGIIGAGTALRPMEVSQTVQDATGTALTALQNRGRK